MTTKYSVIQYLPSPLADERINVGIIAFNDKDSRVMFTESWSRVQYFAGEDEPFLRDLKTKLLGNKEEVQKLVLHIERTYMQSQDDQAKTTTWMSVLQFTEPQTSIHSVQKTLEMIRSHFLPTITTPDEYSLPTKRAYQLDELLAGVTPELIGGEYDWSVRIQVLGSGISEGIANPA
jgi:hypothetical protein